MPSPTQLSPKIGTGLNCIKGRQVKGAPKGRLSKNLSKPSPQHRSETALFIVVICFCIGFGICTMIVLA